LLARVSALLKRPLMLLDENFVKASFIDGALPSFNT
jgi:hypothetical protein